MGEERRVLRTEAGQGRREARKRQDVFSLEFEFISQVHGPIAEKSSYLKCPKQTILNFEF